MVKTRRQFGIALHKTPSLKLLILGVGVNLHGPMLTIDLLFWSLEIGFWHCPVLTPNERANILYGPIGVDSDGALTDER